jgi:hypothetical protein
MHVFTYGSLMFPAVWTRVVAGSYRSLPATLHGFRRQRVRGQDYPALEHAPAGPGTVEGVLYLEVNADDLAALDAFEGPDYRRIEVPLILGQPPADEPTAAATVVTADTYLFVAADKVEPGDWDPAAFERDRMGRFLREYPPPRW